MCIRDRITALDTQQTKLAESRQKQLDAQAKQTELTNAAKDAAKVKACLLYTSRCV